MKQIQDMVATELRLTSNADVVKIEPAHLIEVETINRVNDSVYVGRIVCPCRDRFKLRPVSCNNDYLCFFYSLLLRIDDASGTIEKRLCFLVRLRVISNETCTSFC